MGTTDPVSLKFFGFACPSCGVPASNVPMEYENGKPVKPKEGWVTEEEITLECGCCKAQGGDRDDGIEFTVKLCVYSEFMRDSILAETAEINKRFGRKE